MINTEFSLSICIPTFNRLHYLQESLDILLPQAQKLQVEVCVSDNHSTDGTANYLAKIARRFSCLHFRVQKKNIGIDKNMLAVISMANGRYIFLLGDDDYLIKGSVEKIQNELDEDSDVIVLNGWHTDNHLLTKSYHQTDDMLGKIFSLPEDAFLSLWDKMPFGSFLADRKCFNPAFSIRYIGTSHAYTGVIWDALAEKYLKTGACKVKCMATPTVLLRGGEKSWRNDSVKIMIYEIPLWFQLVMENDIYRLAAAVTLEKYINNQTSLIKLLSYRASGQLDKKLLDTLVGMYPVKQIELIRKIVALPIKPLERSLAIYFGVKKLIKRIVS